MQDKITIWSSVVVSRLPEPRMCQHKSELAAAGRYKRVQDFRARISDQQVKMEGRAAELRVNVEALFIMEDEQGNLHPVSRRDLIRERIPLSEFWPRLENGKEVSYIAETSDFYVDTLLQGQNLIIMYCLTFMLLAVRDQMITLPQASAESGRPEPAPEPRVEEGIHTNPLLAENIFLRRQLKRYEANLLGLKKSLQKAEQDNAALLRQIKLLQAGPTGRDVSGSGKESKHEQRETKATAEIIPIPTQEERLQRMGRKIKEFFINNA